MGLGFGGGRDLVNTGSRPSWLWRVQLTLNPGRKLDQAEGCWARRQPALRISLIRGDSATQLFVVTYLSSSSHRDKIKSKFLTDDSLTSDSQGQS